MFTVQQLVDRLTQLVDQGEADPDTLVVATNFADQVEQDDLGDQALSIAVGAAHIAPAMGPGGIVVQLRPDAGTRKPRG